MKLGLTDIMLLVTFGICLGFALGVTTTLAVQYVRGLKISIGS